MKTPAIGFLSAAIVALFVINAYVSYEDASVAGLFDAVGSSPLTRTSAAMSSPALEVLPNCVQATIDLAREHVGSTIWNYYQPHPEVRGRVRSLLGGRLAPKCNIFVHDIFVESDEPFPRIDGVVPRASDWFNTDLHLEGFCIIDDLTDLRPGDIISDGDHIGIFLPLEDGSPGVISVSDIENKVVHNDWGFREDSSEIVVRRRMDDCP